MSKDVCRYVIMPMIDRVSAAMLADACGFEIVRGEAFYREAGRLGYWNICDQSAHWEKFACGEGAALGGHLEKMIAYVDRRNFGELFDHVDRYCPVAIWNYLHRHCYDSMGMRPRFFRRVESGSAINGIEIEKNALPYLSDYTELAMIAARMGNGCDFVRWVMNRHVDGCEMACSRGIIDADNVAMWQTFIECMPKIWMRNWYIKTASDARARPNMKAHLFATGF